MERENVSVALADKANDAREEDVWGPWKVKIWKRVGPMSWLDLREGRRSSASVRDSRNRSAPE